MAAIKNYLYETNRRVILIMANLDDLFPGSNKYPPLRPQNISDGGHYYDSSNVPSISSVGKCIDVYVDDSDYELWVSISETVHLPARPSARTKNHGKRQLPRNKQLTRTVWATVAPIDDYDTIADAVHDASAKLRERYLERYKTTLEAPLDYLILLALQASGVQPPGEL